ncbi:hypothetical protein J2Z40_002330 [Cytobacillus eiseniae]|uniref:TadE-like protein n=1 Tax=Cytobacillus eiseniae TaxID=762947 RepID=A0ABS4RFR8_9BACI|nr:pilus assembly protein [Cytobacillus eiseniae]MBP2241758.1 hypothetical protein [Cytobacillus eiseniae]
MFQIKERIREEKGSFTLEFLMVLPYYLFFFLLLWQAVASGMTIMQAQSAVNEAAKIYAITERIDEARDAAKTAIGHSDIMTFDDFDIPPHPGSKEFVAEVKLTHGLVFVPKEWRKVASMQLTHSATGRVLK